MNGEVKELIESCETCRKCETSNQKEPLTPHEVLSRPREQIGVARTKQEKSNGNCGLLQQLLGGQPPNRYYLSSHNTETQKPFCTVWLP